MPLVFEPVFNVEANEIRDGDAEFLLQFAKVGEGFVAQPHCNALPIFGFVCFFFVRFCQRSLPRLEAWHKHTQIATAISRGASIYSPLCRINFA
jgi:hypothetical protein